MGTADILNPLPVHLLKCITFVPPAQGQGHVHFSFGLSTLESQDLLEFNNNTCQTRKIHF